MQKKDNNSYYNFFNKQTISFFPKYSEENSRKLFNSLSPTILEDLLHSSANFENTKALLFHPNDNQTNFF